MMTDPIADFLIQIKNGYLAKKEKVEIPYSAVKSHLAKLLAQEGYIDSSEAVERNNKKTTVVKLLYKNKKPGLTDLARVSKPGRRVYVGNKNIPRVLGGLGIFVVSTSEGLMTDVQARKKKLGGELICKIW